MSRRYVFHFVVFALLTCLIGCYSAPEIEGFDSDQWKAALQDCDSGRTEQVDLLMDQVDKLKGKGQNSIQQLLGKPTRHELYKRNQKFFYYDLSCDGAANAEQIRIRFDALGNLREITRQLKP